MPEVENLQQHLQQSTLCEMKTQVFGKNEKHTIWHDKKQGKHRGNTAKVDFFNHLSVHASLWWPALNAARGTCQRRKGAYYTWDHPIL